MSNLKVESKITEEDLEFMELFHYPPALVEVLFSDVDNIAEYDEEKFMELRLYQYPMLSFEPFICVEGMADSPKKQMDLRKNIGDIVNMCARKIGKTRISEVIDIPCSLIHDDGWSTAISAPNNIHLARVLDQIKSAFEGHDILKELVSRAKGAPTYIFQGKNGWSLTGINMKLKSKDPGGHWVGFHVKKHWGEEYSYETEEVANKRRGSISEIGCISRLSGMTNFTRFTPAGRVYYSKTNEKKIINYPELISPFWSEKEKAERIEQYGGQEMISYQIFVDGKVIEDGFSTFDIERVRKCYMEKKTVKRFELSKKQSRLFKELIGVERPSNADRIFICADVGDGGGDTDIIILSERGSKYRYLYNIILSAMTEPEQERIFKWLILELNANVVAFDCGDALGRSLVSNLEEQIPNIKNNLVSYAGAKKVPVGFLKENGEVVFKNGEPVLREEFMSEWSARRLKNLLYEERMEIPKDYKFDNQINSVVAAKSGTRMTYECTSTTGDHNWSAFRVFAIAQWLKKDFNMTPEITDADWGGGVAG